MSVWQEFDNDRRRFPQREQQELDWHHRFAPGGIEEQYRQWCCDHGLDPEDVGTMTAYEEE